jgi:hypothetical protein
MDERHCPHRENAVGRALSALEPDEEIGLRDHLPVCATCRGALRDAEAVVGLLGAVPAQHQPPPALRHRLLLQIELTPQTTQASTSDIQKSPVVVTPRRWSRTLLAAAAAIVLVLGAATAVLGIQAADRPQTQAGQGVFDDPAARKVLLADGTGHAVAQLVTGKAGAVVIPLSLAPNGPNQSYVFWGVVDGKPQALTTFDVAAGSSGPQPLRWPAAADGLSRFAISLEPGRTMPAAPTQVVATGATT